MFQGNWTCSKCGGAITELPFQPRSDSGLTCRDCYFKDKGGGAPQGGGATAPQDDTIATGPASDMDDRQAPPFDPDMDMGGTMATEPPPPPPDDLDGAVPATPGERKMFQGDWQCSVCGTSITQLPFEPRGDASNLKCIDCFKKG